MTPPLNPLPAAGADYPLLLRDLEPDLADERNEWEVGEGPDHRNDAGMPILPIVATGVALAVASVLAASHLPVM